jgi:hypothetical protein
MKTIQKYTFKGEARPLGPRWEEGFKDGYELTISGQKMDQGKLGNNWGWGSGQYGNGFAEGCLSGLSKLLREKKQPKQNTKTF